MECMNTYLFIYFFSVFFSRSIFFLTCRVKYISYKQNRAYTLFVYFFVELDNRATLTNVFALIANFGIHICWGVVQTMTIELYPTVIRFV